MLKVGYSFDFYENTDIEIKEIYTHPQGERICKVEYIDQETKEIKEGFISESLLKKVPTFPF